MSIINVQDALFQLGNNKAIYNKIIGVYLQDTPGRMSMIETFVKEGAFIKASEALHTLKGSALTIGAEKLALTCHEGKELLRHGINDADFMVKLKPVYQETEVALKEVLK